jgi:DNA recombination protein RmuC
LNPGAGTAITFLEKTGRAAHRLKAGDRGMAMEVWIAVGVGMALEAGVLILLLKNMGGNHMEGLAQGQERLERALRDEMSRGREESGANERASREELGRQLSRVSQINEEKLEGIRQTLERQLRSLQEDNGLKLDQMRSVVEEKLQATLEKRLGESFRQVSDRLEQVHQGLGEMQSLAADVGTLQRTLTNVKTRGTWGEVQLESLLAQVLSPEQYAKNVQVKGGSGDRVEFAIRLPGPDPKGEEGVWLPIDAKFPQEDYQRLNQAWEKGDAGAAEEAARALKNRIKLEAKNIRDKYLDPPRTTDFGILFLPTEGLYAEVLREPGLLDTLQREYRIVVTGPTTLAAILNSLQVGFRTLAIEKRTSDVWKLLGAVKKEFGTFGGILEKTHKKILEAGSSLEDASRKTRTIERKLRGMEQVPDNSDELPAFSGEPEPSGD